jgi:hypothetical protein
LADVPTRFTDLDDEDDWFADCGIVRLRDLCLTLNVSGVNAKTQSIDKLKGLLWEQVKLAPLVPIIHAALLLDSTVDVRSALSPLVDVADIKLEHLPEPLLRTLYVRLGGDATWLQDPKRPMSAKGISQLAERVLDCITVPPKGNIKQSGSVPTKPPKKRVSTSVDLLGNKVGRSARTRIHNMHMVEDDSEDNESGDVFTALVNTIPKVPAREKSKHSSTRTSEKVPLRVSGDRANNRIVHARHDTSESASDSDSNSSLNVYNYSDDDMLEGVTARRFRGCTSAPHSFGSLVTKFMVGYASVEQYVKQTVTLTSTRNMYELERWAIMLDQLSMDGVSVNSISYELAARIFYSIQIADSNSDYECINRFIGRHTLGLPEHILRAVNKSRSITDVLGKSTARNSGAAANRTAANSRRGKPRRNNYNNSTNNNNNNRGKHNGSASQIGSASYARTTSEQ